jgi:hypothetical protein
VPDEQTRFLNVDLELVTRSAIDGLLAHWGALVMLRDSVDDGVRTVWIELEEDHPDADSTLGAFLSLVESLPAPVQKHWDDCLDRCFNIGFQAGITAQAVGFSIAPNTLRRIADSNARVEVTIYGAGPGSEKH